MRPAAEIPEISSAYDRPARGGGVLLVAGLALLLAGGGAVAYALGTRAPEAEPAPLVAPPPESNAGMTQRAPVRAVAEKLLATAVAIEFDQRTVRRTWKDLGLVVDDGAVAAVAARVEREGGGAEGAHPIAVTLDPARALEVMVGMKDSYDRPATDARVDLVSRQVQPEKAGYGVRVYESLAAVEEAARAGATEVKLAGGPIEPAVTLAKLGNLDIGHVMGWWETHYPPGEKDRNYNLKLVAEHVNGHILMPGEKFSFNDVVGDRTEKQGYRVAHVIQAGEMIDGLAGGACQISSTLHGASWFAGLDILSSSPHSRPSTYITMGLDATVVYPSVNLVLRNPYEFPVVIHYVVSQGTVRVEILGRERPWDRIAFEREIKKEIPYDTVTRDDDAMPLGTQVVDQIGFPGYELIRRRIFYRGGKVAKAEKWDIKYPVTTEYVRIGTNPDPNLRPPEVKEPHGPMAPGGTTYHIEQ